MRWLEATEEPELGNWWMDWCFWLQRVDYLSMATACWLRGQTAERWKCLMDLSISSSPSLSLFLSSTDPLRDVTWRASRDLNICIEEKEEKKRKIASASLAAFSNQRLKDWKKKQNRNWSEKEKKNKAHCARQMQMVFLVISWHTPLQFFSLLSAATTAQFIFSFSSSTSQQNNKKLCGYSPLGCNWRESFLF